MPETIMPENTIPKSIIPEKHRVRKHKSRKPKTAIYNNVRIFAEMDRKKETAVSVAFGFSKNALKSPDPGKNSYFF